MGVRVLAVSWRDGYTFVTFIKLTRSGSRTYAQLVESFRDEHGKPRQRTVATLGSIDEQDGQVDALLNGLLRAKGCPAVSSDSPQLRFESAPSLGDVWALDALWHELDFDSLGAVFRRARFATALLGRANWLFAGSLRAGKRAAAIMSLLRSARINGHEPYAYFKDVLDRLPTHPANCIDELLPHRWSTAS